MKVSLAVLALLAASVSAQANITNNTTGAEFVPREDEQPRRDPEASVSVDGADISVAGTEEAANMTAKMADGTNMSAGWETSNNMTWTNVSMEGDGYRVVAHQGMSDNE